MYNSGNSSKNVTGASVVDGTLENADYADNAISGDKIDGGTISNFTSTGIDDNATSTSITIDASENVSVDGEVTCTNLVSIAGTDTGNPVNAVVDSMRVSGYGIQANRGAMFLTNAATDGLIHMGNSGAHNSNILASFTSNGLTFNGDTAAANALDDYEEGTWTPAFLSTDASWTYSTQKGNYTKTGNTVHFRAYITTTAASGTLSNGLQISGLPFAVVNTTNSLGNVTIGYAYNFDMSQTTGGTGVPLFAAGRTEENSSIISILATRNDAVAYSITAEATNSNPCRLIVDGFYFTS